MKKPTPDELEQLREAYPKGAPRVDYRTANVERATYEIVDEGGENPGDAATDATSDDSVAEDDSQVSELVCQNCMQVNESSRETCSRCGAALPRSLAGTPKTRDVAASDVSAI